MSKAKQNLRKGQTLPVEDLDNLVNAVQNTISQRTRRQVITLKLEFPKVIQPLEKQNGNKKNAKYIKQIDKGTNKKTSKKCISQKLKKQEVFSDILIDEYVLENGNKNVFQRAQMDDKSSKQNENNKLQSQNLMQQNFILDMIALQARSELRLQLDWNNHELWNEEISQKNENLCKILQDESHDQDSVMCYSFFSNDNEIIKNCVIQKKNKKEIQRLTYNIDKLEEFAQDWNQIKFEENISYSKDQNHQNEVGIFQTLKAEDQQKSFQQDDELNEAKIFQHFLNEATYENPSRNSCKEIHKLIRLRHDKNCVDVYKIDHLWSELHNSKELNELSFQQFLKCIIDMHDQDLLWLDQQKRRVYLI
ncbi:unnamed protein product (macronuclear) [Paramecium tetraurelia]|uniref:Uncharacterized protein n=1 Tax=Paramecium tetraurelia TaxID=5888 RepID=A0CKS6_PARTE|nr:uncharacterized protein GSPATT00007939001 [Paramecium tetraurelia]CAK71393.1 unnamed protein product [Paramecium tetraurelia]|eukprot:XP_001438790.1 hypothetical protein (macronuclear) [Paramecium tetraurelia strain d4-2]